MKKGKGVKKGQDMALDVNYDLSFMFDTNIFNRILDRQIDIASFNKECSYFATRIQYDEVCATPNPERRAMLIGLFKDVSTIPTSSAVVGISRVGECKIPDDDLYQKLLAELDRLGYKQNNKQDGLIGDTVIKNGFTLVSEDCNLREAVKKFGGKVKLLDEFLHEVQT